MLRSKKVLWFTGLSGSGKTTLANLLKEKLEKKGIKTAIFDGDAVREKITRHLGFSKEDIWINNKTIAELVVENKDKFDVIIVPVISPYREHREKVREIIGNSFNEIYIKASLEECMKRDVKGLYKKALEGEIDNMIGFSEKNPYQPPRNPELVIDTEKLSTEESLNKLLDFLNV